MSIQERLAPYGPSMCPLCDNRRETVFGRRAGELVCRRHPGHPLFESERPDEGLTTPARTLDSVAS